MGNDRIIILVDFNDEIDEMLVALRSSKVAVERKGLMDEFGRSFKSIVAQSEATIENGVEQPLLECVAQEDHRQVKIRVFVSA